MHHDVAARTLIHNLVKDFKIPQVLTVRQKFDACHVTDLEAELEKEFQRAAIERRWARIKPGDRSTKSSGEEGCRSSCLPWAVMEEPAPRVKRRFLPALASPKRAWIVRL